MALIKFRDWLAKKNEDMSNAMGPELVSPNVQELHAKLLDPATPPEAKQNIQLQLQQLQSRSTQGLPTTQGRPNQFPNNQQAQPTNPNSNLAPNPNGQPGYTWKNGKPVPANMNQV
jgi:hypothetical protein